MDTRFWGPPGWRLLHTIAASYQPETQRKNMKEFLEVLPYILPCKFCRTSLTEYYDIEPYDKHLGSARALSKWFWIVHNNVNAKLKEQGQNLPENPAFEQIYKYYLAQVPRGEQSECEMFPGWDFLFSVAYNHPLKTETSSMPNAPPESELKTDRERNRWNVLRACIRYKYWRKFWSLLPAVLPEPWRSRWLSKKEKECFKNRKTTVAWLWRKRCLFSEGDPYNAVCKRLVSYSSGCSTSLKARTCRRLRLDKKKAKKRTIRH